MLNTISTLGLIYPILLIIFVNDLSAQTCANQMMNNPDVIDLRVCENDTTDFIPIIDLTNGSFAGMTGGLYPGGTNEMPQVHKQLGIDLSNQILPLDTFGNVDLESGKIVFASIGMSNCMQYFQYFLPFAESSPLKDDKVLPLNLAIGGKDINALLTGNYFGVVDTILSSGSRSMGVPIHRLQVQAIWFLQATLSRSIDSLEQINHIDIVEEKFLDAFILLKQEFPNLRQIFCSGRDYGGYNPVGRGNPEPYAYYTNWAFKKLIDRQINGDPMLNSSSFPWIAWADYIWANGTSVSSDGYSWECDDQVCDGVHPSQSGKAKVANKLLTFFETDPTTAWFRESGNPNTCLELADQGIKNSFENSLESWSQRSTELLDWKIQTGHTPSQNTGPSTAMDGEYYLYIESDEGFNNRAILESNCIELSMAENIYLSLGAHMFGTNINRLRVAIKVIDSGALINQLTIQGEQGNEWIMHQIDITDFAGQTIQVVIEGKTGNGVKGDIGIDNIRLNYCNPTAILNDDIVESGLYQASETIYSNADISTSLDVIYRAEQSIHLLDNFEVSHGTLFLVEIGACL